MPKRGIQSRELRRDVPGSGLAELVWASADYLAGHPTHGDVNTFDPSLNRLHLWPLWVPVTVEIDQLACEVTTLTASSVARMGLYLSDGTGGKPATLLLDAGTIDSSTTGVKTIAISQVLQGQRLYWLAFVAQTADGAVFQGNNKTGTLALPSSVGADESLTHYVETGVTGALPDPTTPVGDTTEQGSVVWVRLA
jgi:hypothetical protein